MTSTNPASRDLGNGIVETQVQCPDCGGYYFQRGPDGISLRDCPGCSEAKKK